MRRWSTSARGSPPGSRGDHLSLSPLLYISSSGPLGSYLGGCFVSPPTIGATPLIAAGFLTQGFRPRSHRLGGKEMLTNSSQAASGEFHVVESCPISSVAILHLPGRPGLIYPPLLRFSWVRSSPNGMAESLSTAGGIQGPKTMLAAVL